MIERTISPLSSIAERQWGVFARWQALDAGYSDDQIKYRVRTGQWEIVLPAVYRIAGTPASVRQRLMASVLWAGGEAVVSHSAAGVLWGLDGIRMGVPEITVPRRLRSSDIAVHFASEIPVADRDRRYGIPVTTAARTLIDIASVVDGEILESALESALRRRLTTTARLQWRVEQLRNRAGTAGIRRLLDQRQNRPLESRLEVRFERLLRKFGLPLPERQRVVKDQWGRKRADFCYAPERIVIECVSWRRHSGQKAWRHDMRRRRALAAQGWRMLEFTWQEISWEPELVVAEVREALAYSSTPSSNSA